MLIDLQVMRVHIGMEDTFGMEPPDRLAKGPPESSVDNRLGNICRKRHDARNSHRDDIGRIEGAVTAVSRRRRPRHPQTAVRHFRQQPPLGERTCFVLTGE